ncbi:MAG TPA: XdhC family protein [Gammaproteobacteria bacterium]|nr:XdhC family protein [Gammaproteobacteria bacterium]
MNNRRIIESFDRWRNERMPMALATVYETLGSTYSKAGHRIVIAADGRYSGLISGGCLEGDLAEHAAQVLRARSAAPVTYDLRDEVDDVFGLGVGCNGLIRVFIQPLLPEQGYEPFATLRALYDRPQDCSCATVIESDEAGLPSGATFLFGADGACTSVGSGGDAQTFAALVASWRLGAGEPRVQTGFIRRNGLGVLFAPIVPIPRLLVLGAGLDAIPLVRMAIELGWYVEIVDHRPAYLQRGEFSSADAVRLVDPRSADHTLGPHPAFDAAVVMSHHLETDAAYLRVLAASAVRYLGVLGPPARREKLLERLEAEFPDLRRRLHGPIGLDIGGAGPSAIALSILAQLQSVFGGAA